MALNVACLHHHGCRSVQDTECNVEWSHVWLQVLGMAVHLSGDAVALACGMHV